MVVVHLVLVLQMRQVEVALVVVMQAVVVVVVSADGNLQQKATSLGASGYLRKPIEIEALLAIVSRYCKKNER